jgi:hypothetical protein
VQKAVAFSAMKSTKYLNLPRSGPRSCDEINYMSSCMRMHVRVMLKFKFIVDRQPLWNFEVMDREAKKKLELVAFFILLE